MSGPITCPPPGLSRRSFLGLASATIGLWASRSWAHPVAGRDLPPEPALLNPFEREHLPSLLVPAATANAGKVPIVVEMIHPMTPDHHVMRVRLVNARAPAAPLGVFHLTPGSGRVYLALQARLPPGLTELRVTAECNRHGAWSSHQRIEVEEEGGGCSGAGLAVKRTEGDDLHPPEIRIPELVRRGRIVRDEVIHPQVKIRHPSRAAEADDEGSTLEPFYLQELAVRYCDEHVSRLEMTSALSDDPFIGFALLARREGPLAVRFVDNRGQRFEATHEIRFSTEPPG
ncbi:MAG TPA: thiosulfate oxidation carrier complex protein SoxZ [Anaeromyxobacteraceae bacterium]|nr:thiosulfate oxidation carrier complex protein SoxZ [Anaeromyxobacteraceae bacterium]